MFSFTFCVFWTYVVIIKCFLDVYRGDKMLFGMYHSLYHVFGGPDILVSLIPSTFLGMYHCNSICTMVIYFTIVISLFICTMHDII